MQSIAFIINGDLKIRGGISMATEQVSKSVDLLWDSWLNSFKSIQQLQDDVEKKTLEAFNYQKEFLESTVTALNSFEVESKKATKELQEKVQQSSEIQSEQFSKWLGSVQEITEKAQSFAWKPSTTFFDVIAQTQNQLESTVKSALEQQKQERTQTFDKIEELSEQLKETQKSLLVAK